MRLTSSVFLWCLVPVVIWSAEAHACGSWFLQQADKAVRMDFSWKSVTLTKGREALQGLFDEKEPIPVEMTVKKQRIVIDGSVIREGEIQIGRIGDDEIEVKGKIYRVTISMKNERESPLDYVVSVRHGERVMLSGRAMSLLESCGHGVMSATLDPPALKDMRHRIAFALVLASL